MRERELTVAGLAATLALPEGDVRGGVVPLHPASDGSRRQFLFEHLVDTLVPRGVAVLRFDRRPSPAGDVPFEAQADDALEALRDLRALPEVGAAPLGLWAWSQGAWAAAVAAARSTEVAYLILLAACGVSPAEQMRYGTAEQMRYCTAEQLRRSGYDDEESFREPAELRAALESALRDPAHLDAAQALVDRYAERHGSRLPTSRGRSTRRRTGRTWTSTRPRSSPRCNVPYCSSTERKTSGRRSSRAWPPGGARPRSPETPPSPSSASRDHAPTIGGVQEPDAISPRYTQALVDWVDDRLAER